jgi:membrane-bound lytic murein transglycosylase F
MCRYVTTLLLGLALAGCESPTLLERIKQEAQLVVATRNSPTTYYEGPHGPTGLEYELVSLFAQKLGVSLRLVIPDQFEDILPRVAAGEVHFAAAGLTVTEARKERVRFSPSYQMITPQLIYRMGNRRPKGWDGLKGHLEVMAGSSHAARLRRLQQQHPRLRWTENTELESEQLLNLVWEEVIDYTIADSNEVALNQRFYPELKVALDLAEPQPLAWAFPLNEDTSLYDAASVFLFEAKKTGVLDQLLDRHYGHVERFDYVGTRRYMRHIEQRLPEYRPLFEAAAKQFELDWRLLAAMGYQESHWNPKAESPTGVRGIMMLTLATMRQLGLSNRLDPRQSIEGGARYFARIRERIPEPIAEPDRTWMALAAYNVGMGHLEDARVLTEQLGGDPDRWVDVKKHLPLLSQKKWYQQTKYGYARGMEPVRYVDNIRSYYDILVWYSDKDRRPVEVPKPFDFSLPTL